MKKILSFFEIPANDFDRAVNFYENVFGLKLTVMDGVQEKMAFSPEEDGVNPGAISWTGDGSFQPTGQGVLISLRCENMEKRLPVSHRKGEKSLPQKQK